MSLRGGESRVWATCHAGRRGTGMGARSSAHAPHRGGRSIFWRKDLDSLQSVILGKYLPCAYLCAGILGTSLLRGAFALLGVPQKGGTTWAVATVGLGASLPCSVCNPAAPLAIIYSGQSLLFFFSYCLISVARPSQLFCVPVLQCRQPAVRGKDLDKCKSHPLGF